MEEASPIPIEAEVPCPRHRGGAYEDFEKRLSYSEQVFIKMKLFGVRKISSLHKYPCISINFYKEGDPIEDELTAEELRSPVQEE